jgi:hypothetical protein
MGSGKPIPGHVYDEIDTYIEQENWELALDTISKTINAYWDKKLNKYNCLWLYSKGAHAAQEYGSTEFLVSFLGVFIAYGEELIKLGPHVLNVVLGYAKIRPPRQDEIAAAKALLEQAKQEYFKHKTEDFHRPPDEVKTQLSKWEKQFVAKSGSCMLQLAVFSAIIVLLLLVALSL